MLVRSHGEPIDLIEVELDGARPVILELERALEALGRPQQATSSPEGLSPLATQPTVPQTVVIGTRGRASDVVQCVRAVLATEGQEPLEVIVVDNGSTTQATPAALAEEFGADDRVTCVSTPIAGLSRARNIGLASARYEVTSFLSDDIVVDALWRRAVARGFARGDAVGGVTGLCPPLHLDNDIQRGFEGLFGSGWKPGFVPRMLSWDSAPGTTLPFSLGLSHGSNMSFRTSPMRQLGGFDETLGPGTPVFNGEDLEFVWRMCDSGRSVCFEPAAIGWNAETYEGRTIHQILWRYGIGLTASLVPAFRSAHFRSNLRREFPRMLRGIHRPSLDHDSHEFSASPTRAQSVTTGVARTIGLAIYLVDTVRRWMTR